jgi:transposase InsO family protein
LEHIIAHFQIPSLLVSNNRTLFKNNDLKKLLEIFNIQHHFLTPYYPKSNGLTKSTNKNLEQILNKMVSKRNKDWQTQLTYALWAYEMNTRSSTTVTPYKLVYINEVVMSLELKNPSLRVHLQEFVNDDN